MSRCGALPSLRTVLLTGEVSGLALVGFQEDLSAGEKRTWIMTLEAAFASILAEILVD